jgi:hypothetical protein
LAAETPKLRDRIAMLAAGAPTQVEKFRACLVWAAEGPEDVEIVDYH